MFYGRRCRDAHKQGSDICRALAYAQYPYAMGTHSTRKFCSANGDARRMIQRCAVTPIPRLLAALFAESQGSSRVSAASASIVAAQEAVLLSNHGTSGLATRLRIPDVTPLRCSDPPACEPFGHPIDYPGHCCVCYGAFEGPSVVPRSFGHQNERSGSRA